jgi:hypothetical protein
VLESLSRTGTFELVETVNFSNYLGTPFCPSPGTVRKIATDLQVALETSGTLSLYERHNLYALYTSMLIAYGTGYRAIKDPSFNEIEIDFDYGIGIVCDTKTPISYPRISIIWSCRGWVGATNLYIAGRN